MIESKISFNNFKGKLYITSAPGYPLMKRDHIIEDLEEVSELNPDKIIVLLANADLIYYYSTISLLFDIYKQLKIPYIHFPIGDFGVPNNLNRFNSLVRVIVSSLKEGDVLIHCAAGKGRSGLLAACILVFGGTEAGKAIRYIRMKRLGAIETKAQEDFIYEYEQFLFDSN